MVTELRDHSDESAMKVQLLSSDDVIRVERMKVLSVQQHAQQMSQTLPPQREYPKLSSMEATQMSKLYAIVTVTTVVANVYAAITDVLRPNWVLDNMAEVGVPRPWLPLLATLKGAGDAGLLLGLMGFRAAGPATGSGLLLFFTGALTAHVRARAFHNVAFPGAYLALAIASLTLSIDHERGAADNTRPEARNPSVAGHFA